MRRRDLDPVTLDSPYALEVLADAPVYYHQLQDYGAGGYAQGLEQMIDSGSAGQPFNVRPETGSSGLQFRLPGPLTSANDRCIGQAPNSKEIAAGVFDPPVDPIMNNFTVEIWVKPGTITFTNRLIYIGQGGVFGWTLEFLTSRKFRYALLTPSAFAGARGAQSTALTAGVWSHIAVVRDSGTWKYYINGSVDNASAGSDSPTAISGPGTVIYGITDFEGDAAHLAYYDSVLSPTRIAAHYAAR